jgi:site-specific recombinase XerD
MKGHDPKLIQLQNIKRGGRYTLRNSFTTHLLEEGNDIPNV